MKEISRRVKSTESEGIACGPVSMYAVDAEIVVEDEGKEVFIHAQYISEVGDISFEAHTQSIYDIYMEIEAMDWRDREAFDAAIARRNKMDVETRISDDIDIEERYAEQCEQLTQMIRETVEKDGYEFDDLDYEEDEDEEDDGDEY